MYGETLDGEKKGRKKKNRPTLEQIRLCINQLLFVY